MESFHENYYSRDRGADKRDKISGQYFPDFSQVFPELAAECMHDAGLTGDPADFDFYVRPANPTDYLNGLRTAHVIEVFPKNRTAPNLSPLRGDNSWNRKTTEPRGGIDYTEQA